MKKPELDLIQEKNYLHNKIQSYIVANKEKILEPHIGKIINLEIEKPLLTGNYLQGIIDIRAVGEKGTANIEIKSYLYDAAGAIAQLNLYEKFSPSTKKIIATILSENDINKLGGEKDEVSQVKWVPLKELKDYDWAFDHYKIIRRIWKKIPWWKKLWNI